MFHQIVEIVFICFRRREEQHHVKMTTISEDADSDDEEMEFSTMGNQV